MPRLFDARGFGRSRVGRRRSVTVLAALLLCQALVTTQVIPVEAGVIGQADTLVAGAAHTCALTGGVVRCWGSNAYGQLGNGTTTPSTTPVAVLATAGGAPLTGVTSLTAGNYHTCARLSDGSVRCWGRNTSGQLGIGSTSSRSLPTTVKSLSGATLVAGGASHTCARLSTGRLKCWGANTYGQLGDRTTTRRLTPVTVRSLSGARAITAGAWHTCAIVSSSGLAKCWGRNNYGQLGDGSTSTRHSPVSVKWVSRARSIDAGKYHTCAVVGSTGYVRCWGRNTYGQLGDGTTTRRLTRVSVKSLRGATSVDAGTSHTCARLASGRAKCWGLGRSGQLGDGSTVRHLAATTVKGLAGASRLAAGAAHTCALLVTGGASCWGSNGSGRLGDGTTEGRTRPVGTVGLVASSLALTIDPTTIPADGRAVSTVTVLVRDESSAPVAGVLVRFAISAGDVSLSAGAGWSDSMGRTTATAKASMTSGWNTISAVVTGGSVSATIELAEIAAFGLGVLRPPDVNIDWETDRASRWLSTADAGAIVDYYRSLAPRFAVRSESANAEYSSLALDDMSGDLGRIIITVIPGSQAERVTSDGPRPTVVLASAGPLPQVGGPLRTPLPTMPSTEPVPTVDSALVATGAVVIDATEGDGWLTARLESPAAPAEVSTSYRAILGPDAVESTVAAITRLRSADRRIVVEILPAEISGSLIWIWRTE